MLLARPWALGLLIPWTLLLAASLRASNRRRAAWRQLGQDGAPSGDGTFGGLGAILFLLVALAQPQWGTVGGGKLPPGRDVVLLIDASRSMAAEDAVPSRIGVAAEAARSLLDAMAAEPGDRAAVVAFAGGAAVRCGLTENLGAVADTVASIVPGSIRPGGTDLAAGIETALGAFDDRKRSEGRMIVVFTDGEDHAGAWRDRIGELLEAGIVVDSVAIGDADAGHPVPDATGGTLSYHGELVLTRRTDEALDALATATGGTVVRLGLKTADLGSLYRDRLGPAVRRAVEASRPPHHAERFGLFVMAALMLLLIGTQARIVRRSRLALATVSLMALGAIGAGSSAAREIEEGRQSYERGDLSGALGAFERAEVLAPESAIPRYDAAAALFGLGRYPEAIARYRAARDRADVPLRIKIDYGLGNASLLNGNFREAIAHYDACIGSALSDRSLDEVRRDAGTNRSYAARLLEDQERPPPRPEDGDNQTTPPKPLTQAAPDSEPVSGGSPVEGPSSRGPSPPVSGTEPADPERQLDDALERVKNARRRRLSPSSPPVSARDVKDW